MTDQAFSGRQVSSRVRSDGQLELSLIQTSVGPPGPDEVVVQVEATPVNPSDLALLLAGADPSTATQFEDSDVPTTLLRLPPGALSHLSARLDQPQPVGNEGAGTVVAAGERVSELLGRVVACPVGGMWTQFRLVPAAGCLVLEPGTTGREAASAFVNPMTALALLETAQRDGHTALVHTAAASNLGQMLVRVCLAEDVGLVNVVRSDAQADLLRLLGAQYVCNSSADDFDEQLRETMAATGATVVFDAVGGGSLAGQILLAMEAVLNRAATTYSPYGSPIRKQAYIYGRLDPEPLVIDLGIGLSWDVSGWLLGPFLSTLGPDDVQRLRSRVASELTTTFASGYGAEITFDDLLVPEHIAQYARRGTGQKYLLMPN